MERHHLVWTPLPRLMSFAGLVFEYPGYDAPPWHPPSGLRGQGELDVLLDDVEQENGPFGRCPLGSAGQDDDSGKDLDVEVDVSDLGGHDRTRPEWDVTLLTLTATHMAWDFNQTGWRPTSGKTCCLLSSNQICPPLWMSTFLMSGSVLLVLVFADVLLVVVSV